MFLLLFYRPKYHQRFWSHYTYMQPKNLSLDRPNAAKQRQNHELWQDRHLTTLPLCAEKKYRWDRRQKLSATVIESSVASSFGTDQFKTCLVAGLFELCCALCEPHALKIRVATANVLHVAKSFLNFIGVFPLDNYFLSYPSIKKVIF